MHALFKISRLPVAILLCIILQSCAKDIDLISEYVVLDTEKTEYRSVKFINDFEKDTSGENVGTVSITFDD
ncbi:hypothetical protein [Maribacter arcticus]|uniref:hypothetical protein n=1 Tax=Maribacter arcticus TaxID=561365 RepID=UPI003001B972